MRLLPDVWPKHVVIRADKGDSHQIWARCRRSGAVSGTFAGSGSAERCGSTGATAGALSNVADAILRDAIEVPVAANTVIQLADALLHATVHEQAVGSEYLATLKGVIEVKY